MVSPEHNSSWGEFLDPNLVAKGSMELYDKYKKIMGDETVRM